MLIHDTAVKTPDSANHAQIDLSLWYRANAAHAPWIEGAAIVSAALVLLTAFVPGCQPEDWRYQVALAAGFSGITAFLTVVARRMRAAARGVR
jgi:hypothetical protein